MKKKSFHRLVNLGVEFGSTAAYYTSGGNDGIRRRRGATNSIKSFLKPSLLLPFPALNNNKQTATLINYTLEYYCISQIQIMLMRRGFFVVPELSLFEFHGSGGMWFCCSMNMMVMCHRVEKLFDHSKLAWHWHSRTNAAFLSTLWLFKELQNRHFYNLKQIPALAVADCNGSTIHEQLFSLSHTHGFNLLEEMGMHFAFTLGNHCSHLHKMVI